MKYSIKFVSIVVITFSLGCDTSENQINLFFNPSMAFDLKKISVKVKIDQDVILDTIIENKHIDEMLFIKNFSYKASKKALLNVEINGKNKDVKGIQELPRCTDIFLRYDDHSLIFEAAKKIQSKREDKHMQADFKQLFDSIRTSSTNEYHQIFFSIKEGNCGSL